ncbi:hypothetical protein MVEN_00843200 [Mycena venus]|uniref:Uncharacterized protein n=1 Tax=Mycena venus TaxID=2733690 RepID=A0A8H6YHA3_9AGAR|nr:hypothetical protein MVEN_00843200 [Mycena venus]
MLAQRRDESRLRTNMTHAKTPGRENVNRPLLRTVLGKGKRKQNPQPPLSLEPPRPKSPMHCLLPLAEHRSRHPKTRPLGDKTPKPNREPPSTSATSLPREQKIAKLVLETNSKSHDTEGTTPASAPRPSSARTHVRAPRNSSGSVVKPQPPLPGTNEPAFRTPATNDRPCDVSPFVLSPLPLPVPEAEEQDDYDEVEYMPSKVDLETETWVPPLDFGLPDYEEVGRDMQKRTTGCAYDDEETVRWMGDAWEMPALGLPELDADDPFVSASASTPKRKQDIPRGLQLPGCGVYRPDIRRQLASSVAAAPASAVAVKRTTGAASRAIIPKSTRAPTGTNTAASTRTLTHTKSATGTRTRVVPAVHIATRSSSTSATAVARSPSSATAPTTSTTASASRRVGVGVASTKVGALVRSTPWTTTSAAHKRPPAPASARAPAASSDSAYAADKYKNVDALVPPLEDDALGIVFVGGGLVEAEEKRGGEEDFLFDV